MTHEESFFNALIEYIDCRIDAKLADCHDSDDTALGFACVALAAKDDLRKALANLSRTLFAG